MLQLSLCTSELCVPNPYLLYLTLTLATGYTEGPSTSGSLDDYLLLFRVHAALGVLCGDGDYVFAGRQWGCQELEASVGTYERNLLPIDHDASARFSFTAYLDDVSVLYEILDFERNRDRLDALRNHREAVLLALDGFLAGGVEGLDHPVVSALGKFGGQLRGCDLL